MTVAQRFTTEFIDFEDRVSVTAQMSDNEVVVLWITRRLLDRLVPHLAGLLERQTSTTASPEVRQSFAQHAAQATRAQQSQQQPQEPVTVQQATAVQEWLVREVDVIPGQQGVNLRFRGLQTGQVVQLGMPEVLLRQWLGIVHNQYQRAAWPVDAWPNWINEDKISSLTSGFTGVTH